MTVQEIARITRGKLRGDGKREIYGVASLEEASPQDLAFAEDARAVEQATASGAGCILVPGDAFLPGQTQIAVAHPKVAFIQAAQLLYPVQPPAPGIHPSAVISPEAQLAPGTSMGPGVVIEGKVKVGSGTRVAAGVFLGDGVVVGDGCALYPRAVLYPGVRLGNEVVLHAGVVVGGDGFGYIFAEGKHQKFPQIGSVIIEDAVEIGANTTIDRGSLGITVIGYGTKIDNLVQIAHNVHIGRHCVIAAQTGISGSVEIGDYVVIGGQVGIGDHARIENRAVIGSQAGILPGKTIREGSVVWGTPARPLADFKRLYAQFAHLPTLARKVNKLSGR